MEIVVEELATRMVQMGHQVVAYNRKAKHASNGTEYKGVKIIQVPTIEQKGLNALVYSALATCRAVLGKYDVLHFHAEGPCAMLWLPKLLGLPTVATIHGLDWKRAKWGGLATRYIHFGEKMAAKYADQVIVLSQNMQQYFKQTYNRDTIYLPNGVTIPTRREASKITEEYGLKKDSYILFLARIVPEKGVHYLVEAFKETDTDQKLVIAGGASHSSDYYEKIKKLTQEDERIIMTGFVQGQLLEELYSNCSLYVLPSDVEGMPISLLEAMGYGKRCLVSDIPENVELAGEHAMYFKHGDQEELRKKLQEAIATQQGDQMENRKYVQEHFNWDFVTEQTVEVYRQAIEKKR